MKKIILSYLFFGCVILGTCILGLIQSRTQYAELESVFSGNLSPISQLAQANSHIQKHYSFLLRNIIEDDELQMKALAKQIVEMEEAFQLDWKEYTSSDTSDEEKVHIETLQTVLKDYFNDVKKAQEFSEKNQNKEAMIVVNGSIIPASTKILGILDQLIELNKSQAKQVLDKSQKLQTKREWFSYFEMLVSIGACIALGLYVSKGIYGTLQNFAKQLHSISSQLANGSAEVATASQSLSQNVDQQSAGVQETSSTLEEISKMVEKNSENVQRCQAQSRVSRDAVQVGQKTVTDMLGAMDTITEGNRKILEKVNHSSGEMRGVSQLIAEIGNKTRVINDIVFQTRLLSFNASVEAARAGEQGKGFAVVAEEVGALAMMSGKAAKEITEILTKSQGAVEGIIHQSLTQVEIAMTQADQTVNEGQKQARMCAESFVEFLDHVKSLDQYIAEIAQASVEQTKGVVEISSAMNEINHATGQNAAIAHKAAEASQDLNVQIERLEDEVKNLQSFLGGVTVHKKVTKTLKKSKKTPDPRVEEDFDDWEHAA